MLRFWVWPVWEWCGTLDTEPRRHAREDLISVSRTGRLDGMERGIPWPLGDLVLRD